MDNNSRDILMLTCLSLMIFLRIFVQLVKQKNEIMLLKEMNLL
jgi:hypothetical protein